MPRETFSNEEAERALDAAFGDTPTAPPAGPSATPPVPDDEADVNAPLDALAEASLTREERLAAPYNAKIRETIWRALNPADAAAHGATMPENYEIPEGLDPAQGLRAKAEGFIRSRQEALRARNIAAILGDTVEGRKKPLPLKQREKMLEDLMGIIEDHEYRTLSIKIGKDVDGASSPAGDTYGVTAKLTQKTHEKQDQDNLTRWVDFEQTKKTAYDTATNNFYAKLGQERLSQEMALATAQINQDTTLTDAQKTALLAETKQEITKEIAVKTLLQPMRETDMDFEEMKQKQFLESADGKEKTRFERLRMACVGKWNKLPAPLRAAAGWTISTPLKRRVTMAIAGAGVSTAVIALSPALTFAGITFFGAGWVAAPAIFGGRAVRSGIAAVAGYPLHSFFQGRRKKSFEKTRAGIETEQTNRAESEAQAKLDAGANWATLIEAMHATQQETMERLNKLSDKEKSLINKLKWSAIPSVILGTALLAPRIAQATESIISSAQGTPGKGLWPDESRHLSPSPTAPGTLPSVPATPPANQFNTPPGPPPTSGPGASTAPSTTPGPRIQPPSGPKAGYPTGGVDDYTGKYFWAHPIDFTKSAWNDFWNGPRPKASLPPTTGGRPSGVTTPVESAPIAGAARESILSIGARGPQGAIIDDMVGKGIPKPKAGTFASQIWENNKAKFAQDPRVIAEMKKYGYTSIDDMAHRLHTGGKLKMVGFDPAHTDPASIKNVRIEFDENVRAVPRPPRPVVSQQPTAAPRPPEPLLRPSTTMLESQTPPPRSAAPDLTQQNLINPEFNPRGYRTTIADLNQDIPVKDFVARVRQIAPEFVKSRGENGTLLDTTDISKGRSPGILDERQMGIIEKVADKMAKVPPADQNLPLGEALKKYPLTDNTQPGVGRPRAATLAPQPSAKSDTIDFHVAGTPEQVRIRPASQPPNK